MYNIRRDLVNKNDDALADHKDGVYYFSALVIDCLTVVWPILLIFTILAEWAYICAISLVVVISIYILLKRSQSQSHLKAQQHLPSLRMDLGVGSFVVANALVSRQAQNIASMRWKAALRSVSPLVFLGFARLISTSGVDYQVHVGEYGVHWNFFFTLAAVSILTSIIRIHPKYCGIVGMLVLAEVWPNFGLNEYLTSDERSVDIIGQNKEGVYSIFGYWGMYLIGVSLGYFLFHNLSSKGNIRSTQVVKVWVLAASFWILAIILDSYVERVSRRMFYTRNWDKVTPATYLSSSTFWSKMIQAFHFACNFAYVMLVFGQNFQVISILTLAGSISHDKNLVLEEAFNQNMIGVFIVANILTGLINLSVDTLSASPLAAFMILVALLCACLLVLLSFLVLG
ncbi:hypothetical protein VPH35_019245 [Triticum aestivum]